MDIKGRVVVVTGGASGIGEALCRAFAKTGAREVVVADFNEAGAKEVADECGGVAMNCDVTIEDDIARVVRDTEAKFGRIDIFCSNAGIMHYDNTHVASSPDEHWQRAWDIHVMAHVCAARAVLPSMIERGEGYFVNTASAAGLLSQIGSTTYT
ncbi:MAG: SDR family oxidoreductase, partial [Candidatus Hydrogenedentes bacterium]|nr:SDR family oxidoreductase [Candidatus Hydrogenedentota bacterium]